MGGPVALLTRCGLEGISNGSIQRTPRPLAGEKMCPAQLSRWYCDDRQGSVRHRDSRRRSLAHQRADRPSSCAITISCQCSILGLTLAVTVCNFRRSTCPSTAHNPGCNRENARPNRPLHCTPAPPNKYPRGSMDPDRRSGRRTGKRLPRLRLFGNAGDGFRRDLRFD